MRVVMFASLVGTLALHVITPVQAKVSPANPEVAKAMALPDIAEAMKAVEALDAATISDDRAAFSAVLAPDLAVNNPQNGVSVMGATAQRGAAGKISYSAYDRSIEYAGTRDGMVVLMGEEVVVAKADATNPSPAPVHRRFTDIWKKVDGRWLLTVRQATIIQR